MAEQQEQEGLYRCRLITPERTLFDGDTDFVIFRASDGDMGILAGHEPMTTVVGYGLARVFSGDEEHLFAIFGGFAEYGAEGLTILSDDACRPDEVDAERERRAEEIAERDMQHAQDKLKARQAELALRRAQVRLEVSTFPIIRGRHGGDSN